MRVRYAPRATRQLAVISEYLLARSPQAGEHIGLSIRKTIVLMREFPLLAREGRSPGTHERLVPGSTYVIVYEVTLGNPDEIVILGIFHCAQDR